MAPGTRRSESESGRDNAIKDSDYNRDSIGNANVYNRVPTAEMEQTTTAIGPMQIPQCFKAPDTKPMIQKL